MNYRKSGVTFLGMVILNIGISLLMAFYSELIPDNSLVILILSELIIMVPCFIVYLFTKEKFCSVFGIHTIRPGTIFICIAYAMMLAPLVMACNAFSLVFTDNAAQEIFESVDELPFWIMALFVAVIAPIVEEAAFRGIIYTGFRKSGSALRAALLSSLLFGLFHMNINQMLYAMVLGFFFALLREATGSIWPSILGHMTINGGSVLLLLLQDKIVTPEAEEAAQTIEMTGSTMLLTSSVLFVLSLFPTAIAVALLVWISKREYGFEALKAVFLQRKTTRGKAWSIALVCAMLVCCLIIVYSEVVKYI